MSEIGMFEKMGVFETSTFIAATCSFIAATCSFSRANAYFFFSRLTFEFEGSKLKSAGFETIISNSSKRVG